MVNVMNGTIVVNVGFVDGGELMNLGIWYRMRIESECLQRPRTLEKATRLIGVFEWGYDGVSISDIFLVWIG